MRWSALGGSLSSVQPGNRTEDEKNGCSKKEPSDPPVLAKMIQDEPDHAKLCNAEQPEQSIYELTTSILGMLSTHHTDERVDSPRSRKCQEASN